MIGTGQKTGENSHNCFKQVTIIIPSGQAQADGQITHAYTSAHARQVSFMGFPSTFNHFDVIMPSVAVRGQVFVVPSLLLLLLC